MIIKIAHIANPVSGIGVYLDLLTRYSNTQKFEHTILGNSTIDTAEFTFEFYHHIPLERRIHITKDLRCLFRIISILNDLKPDLIHCHSAKAGMLGRIAGIFLKIPTVYTPHAYSYLSSNSPMRRWFYRSIERKFRFFNPRTIACSQSEYDRTVKELNFKKEKVFLWNNSIEDCRTLISAKGVNDIPNDFICSIGRPSYQKNTKLLVDAIVEAKKEIKDIKLLILGVGHYSPDLKNITDLIEENGLTNNITLIPWLKRSETLGFLSRSRCYISTSRYEGLPYAILEAMSLSKPTVATNVDGNKDLIKHNITGYLVHENAKAIAEKIVKLYQDQKAFELMSENARKSFLENYQVKHTIKNLEDIYLTQVEK